MRKFLAALVWALTLAALPLRFGWGREGHEVVALIAERNMTPAALERAKAIFGEGRLSGAEPPQATITNGQINVKLYLPDAKNGYYRGTRFDWSGVIASLQYSGHDYYGPWFDKVDPSVHDYRYAGAEIIASPCSGAVGPVEEFATPRDGRGTALGWAEARVGGTFMKIGVGVLRRDKGDYRLRQAVRDRGLQVSGQSSSITTPSSSHRS